MTDLEREQYLNDIDTQEKIIMAKKYLDSTDWYYTRKMEAGNEVPVDVVAKRIEAREFIRTKSL